MVNKLYSIYDVKTGVFNNPFMCRNADEAKRIVAATATADVHNMLYNFSDDYKLYCLGEFDDEHGTITADSKFVVCTVSEIVVHTQKRDDE